MAPEEKTREYRSPKRAELAQATRQAIVEAAIERFSAGGWAGTTIAAIADAADVSPKTIEAAFATKAAVLGAALEQAGGGSAAEQRAARREITRSVEAVPGARRMLDLHAAAVAGQNERIAVLAWVAEAGAAADARVARQWGRMRGDQRFAARWAAKTLLGKDDHRADLTEDAAEQVFLFADDWNTWRTLTLKLSLSPSEARGWIRAYYGDRLE
jgi:AcrR family transcriptional regulator